VIFHITESVPRSPEANPGPMPDPDPVPNPYPFPEPNLGGNGGKKSWTCMEEYPIIIKEKLTEKRKARKRWQLTRAPQDRQRYNKIAKELKLLLHSLKNEGIQNYQQGLTPTEATDYLLWKVTRKIKQPQHQIPPIRINRNTWAQTDKQKATSFTEHLASVFQPFPSQLTAMDELMFSYHREQLYLPNSVTSAIQPGIHEISKV